MRCRAVSWRSHNHWKWWILWETLVSQALVSKNKEEKLDEGHEYIMKQRQDVSADPAWHPRSQSWNSMDFEEASCTVFQVYFKTPTFLKMSRLLFQHSTNLPTWRMKLRWQRCNYSNLKNPMDSIRLNCQWSTNGQIGVPYIDDLCERIYTPKNEQLEPQAMGPLEELIPFEKSSFSGSICL